jgi:hypothetical protein
MALNPRKAATVVVPERQDRAFLNRTGASKRADPRYSTLSVYINKERHHKFKVKAATRQVEMSDVVDELLSRWIDGHIDF